METLIEKVAQLKASGDLFAKNVPSRPPSSNPYMSPRYGFKPRSGFGGLIAGLLAAGAGAAIPAYYWYKELRDNPHLRPYWMTGATNGPNKLNTPQSP